MAKYCPKCGHLAEEWNVQCESCGEFLNQISSGYSADRLLDIYIGQNVERIKKTGFSFNAFIFGGMYILYRKKWTLGLGYIILVIMLFAIDSIYYNVTNGLSSIIILIALLGLRILIGLKFKKIYLEKAQKNIDNILTQNLDKDSEELAQLCKKKVGQV